MAATIFPPPPNVSWFLVETSEKHIIFCIALLLSAPIQPIEMEQLSRLPAAAPIGVQLEEISGISRDRGWRFQMESQK